MSLFPGIALYQSRFSRFFGLFPCPGKFILFILQGRILPKMTEMTKTIMLPYLITQNDYETTMTNYQTTKKDHYSLSLSNNNSNNDHNNDNNDNNNDNDIGKRKIV
jgi:type II restriction/modification system DNA methylase subunit YeeA